MTVANESTRLLSSKTTEAVTQATQFVAIGTGMTALEAKLEAEAAQEGRQVLLAQPQPLAST
jgi:hypothetical protein